MKRGGELKRRSPLRGKSGCCGKKRYATEEAALIALERIRMLGHQGKVPQRAYRCTSGWYHLTSQKSSPSANVPRSTRDLVMERDEYTCFRCGAPLLTAPRSLQHRDARGMGGSSDPLIHSPANLILLCGTANSPDGCHWLAEQRGEDANVAGFWLRNGRVPADTPVLHWRLGPVFLDHGGGMTPIGRAA